MRRFIWFVVLVTCGLSAFSQEIAISQPAAQAQFQSPALITITASVSGVAFQEPAHIQVTNSLTGFRKLKFGYNPNSIYSPGNNVVAGGNNILKITLRDNGGNTNWNLMQIKPNAQGTLVLAPYISAIGGLGNTWKTITIPLSDFSSQIDFTALTNIEFPYSANAGNFDIAFSEILFTGGTQPFLWFGSGKTDNKHNGNGGPGEIFASLLPAVYPSVYPQKVEFYAGQEKIGEDASAPYEAQTMLSDTGWVDLWARLVMSNNDQFDSPVSTVYVAASQTPSGELAISLAQPVNGSTYESPAGIQVQAEVSGVPYPESDYLLVSNNQSGFRKLKLGYNPVSIYSPNNNVISGGNNSLQITLRDVSGGGTNWQKILLKPMALGNLNLAPYVSAAGGIGQDWKTITIPLADFSPAIDFTQISNIEFPYSADAGFFEIAIKSIVFTGGNSPFVWFGEGKTNNKHNGNGGPGELLASVVLAGNSGEFISRVEFFSDNQLIFEDLSYPYGFIWNVQNPGEYPLIARTTTNYGNQAWSAAVGLEVVPPAQAVSPLTIALVSPPDNMQYYHPANLNLQAQIGGEVLPGPDYLKVVNNQTGFRKLKLGYSPVSIHGSPQNVVAGGNNNLQIILKDIGNSAVWQQIRIRPSATGSLNLSPYMASAIDLGEGWKEINIPLNHFDPAIDFTALSFFEFPYSASAPFFELGILLIKFTGGATPFIWFGEGKTNNAHDGFNGTGQLLASMISGTAGLVQADRVAFYDNGLLLAVDSVAPYVFSYLNLPTGLRKLSAKVTDTDGAVKISDTVNVMVLEAIPGNAMVMTIEFASVPTYADIDKAKLRYNKNLAYSLSLDDGYRCAYTNVFPLLNGGFVAGNSTTYPGLYYTDGCGNDIPFKAGLAWYSLGGSMNDIHVNSTSYVNWPELQVLINAGWNVLNHSLQHAAGAGTNYDFQIVENTNYVRNKTGYTTRHFVIPSGDANYIPAAFANGMLGVYANNAAFLGFSNGLNVTNSLNYNQFKMYRRYMYDGYYDTTNILNPINNTASLAMNGQYMWYNDFTHRVGFTPSNGGIQFPLFAWYMQNVETLYGKSGSDRIWMAPLQEVYEYLFVRDHTPISASLNGSTLTVVIERSQLPDSLLKYALSFVVHSDAEIAGVTLSQPCSVSFRGNTYDKLINIEWEGNVLKKGSAKGDDATGPGNDAAAISRIVLAGNPVKENLVLHLSGEIPLDYIDLFDYQGKLVSRERFDVTGAIHIALNGYKPGMYILRAVFADGLYERLRFIKL